MNVAVLGAGTWGTALAKVLDSNSHNVTLWHYKQSFVDYLESNRVHPKLNCEISKTIVLTSNLDFISNNDIIVIAIPTQSIRHTLKKIGSVNKDVLIVNASKGIEISSLKTISNVIQETLNFNRKNIIAFYGPSHAEEVVKELPTTIVSASDSIENARLIQDLFSNSFMRVYSNNDIIGVEVSGSVKNIIAIAAGITVGVGFGDNTLSALITRGIAEIQRLGIKMGAQEKTFLGLSGIGDLIVTATSIHSRNRKIGYDIGKGKNISKLLGDMTMVAEGVFTSKAIYKLANNMKIEMPICNKVYEILFLKKDPKLAIYELMNRKLIDE